MSRPLAASPCLLLAGCFLGSEFPRSADAGEVEEILAACGFAIRSYAPQGPDGDQLVVDIFENEPDHRRKRQCLDAEAARRDLSVASVGPLPARNQGR